MPISYWGECVLTTVYIISRLPSSILANKTPFEKLYNKPPSFVHLKVFGCLFFSSTLSHNISKFDPRSIPCVFLGFPFSVKGYMRLCFLSFHPLILIPLTQILLFLTFFPFYILPLLLWFPPPNLSHLTLLLIQVLSLTPLNLFIILSFLIQLQVLYPIHHPLMHLLLHLLI